MEHTKPPFRIGKHRPSIRPNVMVCIVADDDTGLDRVGGATGIEAVDYYGGNMVAESVTIENAEFMVKACNFYWKELQAGRTRDFPRPTMPRLLCWLCLMGSWICAAVIWKPWAYLAVFMLVTLVFALFEVAKILERQIDQVQ